MDKQQLARKIWRMANNMRAKIEANEYKDYILGFIFYKFLSEKEVKFLKQQDISEEDLKEVTENATDLVEECQNGLGYFIAYENLFSTWRKNDNKFSVDNVATALSAFDRLRKNNIYEGIFNTLNQGLSKLGENASKQTKALTNLIAIIDQIPMDGKAGYDVLGYIYEYLISNFAANAGKKAGEFYTPHEVSMLMSEIVADHLKEQTEIQIYDPTSGSGSLLINIGKAVEQIRNNDVKIKYYAQELKTNTYDLTRMNLVMRNIPYADIIVRNGDTLADDWPYFRPGHPEEYDPLYVHAVVSNPPYSQQWNNTTAEHDPRFSNYGVAPKGKADYAFLLHDLYHLRSEGIMTIVLPHGVLFRGKEEEKIRRNLIENGNIDTIIGLPANIFFGTSIPTIIMVLRKKRPTNDVLFIDASKEFIKDGKNNRLQARHIKRIVDVYKERKDVPKFARCVSIEEIRQNEYNLNIPRYVDSAEEVTPHDLYATMFGGIPQNEIAQFGDFWKSFPTLKPQIFDQPDADFAIYKNSDQHETICQNSQVVAWENGVKNDAFGNFVAKWNGELVEQCEQLRIAETKMAMIADIFQRTLAIPHINKYEVYQFFADQFEMIQTDLEIIQTETLATAARQVDDNIVIKKDNKTGEESEVKKGFKGHIMPFELVQQLLITPQYERLMELNNAVATLSEEFNAKCEALTDEDYLNYDFTKNSADDDEEESSENEKNIDKTKFNSCIKAIYAEFTNPEIDALQRYALLTKKNDKLTFMRQNRQVDWNAFDEKSKDGTIKKGDITKRITLLQKECASFEEESTEFRLVEISNIWTELDATKKEQKALANDLHLKTKTKIENLTDSEITQLLLHKWVLPLQQQIGNMPTAVVANLANQLQALHDKYATTFVQTTQNIAAAQSTLCQMLPDMQGGDHDMQALHELQKLLQL